MSEVRGKLWSFLRDVLKQGVDIDRDHTTGPNVSYEAYSARLDGAARERADELLALLPAPAWSQERPVKAGYYWFSGVYRPSGIGAGDNQIVWLNTIGDVFTMYGKTIRIEQLDGSWAGPIVPPEGRR